MDKDVFRRDLGSLTDVYKVVLEKLQDLNKLFETGNLRLSSKRTQAEKGLLDLFTPS